MAGCTASSGRRICPQTWRCRSALSGDSGKADPEITDDDETRVRVICGEFWGKRCISDPSPVEDRKISGDEEVP